MVTDFLGRPIELGDTIVTGTTDTMLGSICLTKEKVAEYATATNGVMLLRTDSGTLRNPNKVCVINREISYTEEHHPELFL